MAGSIVLLLFIVLGRSISSIQAYRLCYNCVGAATAADCDTITKCDDQQECFEEKVVHNLNTHYNSGCRSKTSCQAGQSILNGTGGAFTECSKCCDNDFCNIGLCGGGTPRNFLQCLGCSDYTVEISDCNRIEQCGEDEMCYAHRLMASTAQEFRYETGCRPRVQCQGIAQAPIINQCFECCDTPMCNLYKCGSNWTAVMHFQTTTSPAPAYTTLPTTSVWSLPPPHISGLMMININANTILSCTSSEPGVTYTWLYQGSKSLPLGVSVIRESHLAIYGAKSSNVGTFTCVINKNGHQAASDAHVTIISAIFHFETSTSTAHAPITLPTTTIWSLPPPHISGRMAIKLNTDTILSCDSNEPGVTYTWLYQGSRSLPLGVSVSRGNHLVIFGAKSSNVGTYTCVIYKNGHQAASDANVTIISAVMHLQTATTMAQHHVTLPTTTVWSLPPPHISGLMTINLNANTILTCNSNEPGVTYTWLYQGSRLLPLGVHLIDGRHLAISGAKSSNVGTFTCVIYKNGHQAATKANVTIISVKAHVTSVVALPNPPQTGHIVDIHCIATGYPDPTIYWSYTDTMGMTIAPPEISYPDPRTVRINNFEPSFHGGTWWCIAINNMGVDRRSIQM